MEEELQKRNTDCVYFLASPLTCKKGIECEYRHSEIARLNPRDCWYWLSGSCLNPTCGFRHPPLDPHPEKTMDTTSHHDHKTVPVNKTDVPCFFFFNGFCSKGYKCSFLHGQNDTKLAFKPSKSASVEKKIQTGSDTGSTHIDANPNTSLSVPPIKDDYTQDKAKQELKQLAPNNIEERNDFPRMIMSEFKEGDDETNRFIQKRPLLCIDKSSGENVDGGGHIEREDWLESSPGFDVLVDDRLENMVYEQDPDYLLNNQSAMYDYDDDEEEVSVGYNSLVQEGRILYKQEIGDPDDELMYDYIRKTTARARERLLINTLPGRKRQFLPPENSRKGVDLRDHLKKRRVLFDGHFPRKQGSVGSARLISQSRQRHHRNNIIGSRFQDEPLFRGKKRVPHFNKSRQRKQQFSLSQVLRKPISKKRESNKEPDVFTGPKSLDQIKEEKKRAEQKEEDDFQGPKPLSDILKDKKRHQ